MQHLIVCLTPVILEAALGRVDEGLALDVGDENSPLPAINHHFIVLVYFVQCILPVIAGSCGHG